MRATFLSSICILMSCLALLAEPPQNLRCEWQVNPKAIHDPCPEFYWEAPSQSGFRLAVAEAADGFARPLWETSIQGQLPIVEYDGPPLKSATTYYWKVWVKDANGRPYDEPPVQHFTFEYRPMPHYLPSIRTFVNFAGNPEWAKDKVDMCFRKEAKQGRHDILATQYALTCTMVIPSKKADDLKRFCEARGYNFEDCFCHFAQDTRVSLHVGAERAENPVQERLCLGWDPRNDRNNDGKVDDEEFKNLANPKATARERKQARIPIYFWGPPRDDYVMNVGHEGYREFMATVHAPEVAEGFDGIYFDTVPTDVAGPGRNNPVVEYPRQGDAAHQWMRDVQMMLAKIKIALPGKIITANGWGAKPMVIEGFQSENWMNITFPLPRWKKAIEDMRAFDKRGKIQMIQYNPIYDRELAEFGPKVEGVTPERDKMYGLASYYMAHGDFSYFGFGSHPYHNVTRLWFKAIECDIGQPKGEFYLISETETSTVQNPTNLLTNGGFEESTEGEKLLGWKIAEPVSKDSSSPHSGKYSACIASDSTQINNLNAQYVTLKPNTTYTLTAWIKTKDVTGSPGAQVYPYEFAGAHGAGPAITVTGTTDWKRYRQVFTTGDDPHGRITFRMYGATGIAWFDDLELVEGAIFTISIFAREFSKGLVVIRPYAGGSYGDETATLVKLPGAFRPLSADGAPGPPVAEISLRNGEAAILASP